MDIRVFEKEGHALDGCFVVRGWHLGLIKWYDRTSRVQWGTRVFVFASLLLLAFAKWGLETQFALAHPIVNSGFALALGLLTICWLTHCKYEEGLHGRGKRRISLYPLKLAFECQGSILDWLMHWAFPVNGHYHGTGRMIYLTYGSLIGAWFLGFVISGYWVTMRWVLLAAACLGGLVALVMAVNKLRKSIGWWYYRKFERPISDAQRELAEARKQFADQNFTFGEEVALLIQMARNVTHRKVNTEMAEMRRVLEAQLALLIPDQTKREAALFRAGEKLADMKKTQSAA